MKLLLRAVALVVVLPCLAVCRSSGTTTEPTEPTGLEAVSGEGWQAQLPAGYRVVAPGEFEIPLSGPEDVLSVLFMASPYEHRELGDDAKAVADTAAVVRNAGVVTKEEPREVDGVVGVLGEVEGEGWSGMFMAVADERTVALGMCKHGGARSEAVLGRCRQILDSFRISGDQPGRPRPDERLEAQLDQALAGCGDPCRAERIALLDIAYPRDRAELERLRGHAIARLLLITHTEKDIPIIKVYADSADGRTPLIELANRRRSAEPFGPEVVEAFGEHGYDSFVLLPPEVWARSATLRIDLSSGRSKMDVFAFPGEPGVPEEWLEQSVALAKELPEQAAMLELIAREFEVSMSPN